MLLSEPMLAQRRAIAAASLAPLADSLAHDLEPLTRSAAIHVPAEKARLTRAGGRCPRCGALLEFDPWNPVRHRCPHCGTDATGPEHDGMWIMWYQLWLAERALHAAALYAVRGDPVHRTLAERILTLYAERYLAYPNRDNVLGPTRPFFSTYLESIWTLQLACALDLLERAGASGALGAAVRAQLLQPSARLIAEYDEGLSNRQVWNNAALLACAALLGDTAMTQRAVFGPSGLLAHLERGLLADGTWYEGENYHLFAHRGLWYGMTLSAAAGCDIPDALRERYRRAFETPFLTALPDFTFPARRDSQYRVSLRQWRIAESSELGFADSSSEVLGAALRELYREDVPSGDTGRAMSTAEAERNLPAARLTRDDLGWKSLLFARSDVAAGAAAAPASILLPDQGFAVLRRDNGRTYVALDYGETGGGHGHPDRLNLWLVRGDARILEDVGTGSYVDRSLHWYRSTLAHNAPLAGGTSQLRAPGDLLAYDERGNVGWAFARASIAPNVFAERAVVAAAGYLVDEVSWAGVPQTFVDLPIHVAGTAPSIASWARAPFPGGNGLEDGFEHITASEHSPELTAARLEATIDGVSVRCWLTSDAPFVLWRLRGPGPPNEQERDFFVARCAADVGRIRTVIDWSGAVAGVRSVGNDLLVALESGASHAHARVEDEWHVTTNDAPGRIVLTRGQARPVRRAASPSRPPHREITVPRLAHVPREPGALARESAAHRIALGAESYRRSEPTWDEAGRPRATVALAATHEALHIDIVVEKLPRAFAPRRAENPLDNEHPDTNSDGVQIHLPFWTWLLVPEYPAPNVRITTRHSVSWKAPEVRALWQETAHGYALRAIVPLAFLEAGADSFEGDVIVNEMPPPPERERRRGQLVLSGGRGEWIYLRGDRQDSSHFVRFRIVDA